MYSYTIKKVRLNTLTWLNPFFTLKTLMGEA